MITKRQQFIDGIAFKMLMQHSFNRVRLIFTHICPIASHKMTIQTENEKKEEKETTHINLPILIDICAISFSVICGFQFIFSFIFHRVNSY